MIISFDPQEISDYELAHLFEDASFGAMAAEELVKRVFPPGVFMVAAIGKDRKLVGLARVFSDDSICSWISELCVLSEHKNTGVEALILDSVIERFGHTAIFSSIFEQQLDQFATVGITLKTKLRAVSRAPTKAKSKLPNPIMQ